MNKLGTSKRAQIVRALVEGNSLRSTSRMAGVSINTVTKLLVDVGNACAKYQDGAFRNLNCKRIQCDEIWSFCYAKEKNVPAEKRGQPGVGDVWTWTAICADTKLVPCWHVGSRNASCAYEFMTDLSERLQGRIQLTTDGHKAYLEAVESAFGIDIDYAMLVKLYDQDPAMEKRYSPAKCIGAVPEVINGNPEMEHVSTSYVERQNLTMRMGMRRFTRLTNASSKKIENHMHAIALHFMYYNFCRIHKTLRVTPAMEAGVSNRVWDVEDIVALLEKDSN
ncbi:MAG: IS1 family transposase [Deltaproteobacteria bacterium]|nr:IS1 family transposase [Deltaproteobacteria bacterium]